MVLAAPISAQVAGARQAHAAEVRLGLTAAHRVDSPVVIDPDMRGVWYLDGELTGRLVHALLTPVGRLAIDHELRVEPMSTPSIESGVDGTGLVRAGAASLAYTLHRAAFTAGTAPIQLTVGRTRVLWGVDRTFGAGDILHPVAADARVAPGMDGVHLAYRQGLAAHGGQRGGSVGAAPTIALDAVIAVQEAIASGRIDDSRLALQGDIAVGPARVGAGVAWQYATSFRPGVTAEVGADGVRFYHGVWWELIDPRRGVRAADLIFASGVEFALPAPGAGIRGSIGVLYNDLADRAPLVTSSSYIVTTDLAGGFTRPGRVYIDATLGWTLQRGIVVENGLLANLSDLSGIVRHDVSLAFGAAIAALTIDWAWGEAGYDEFGRVTEDFVVTVSVTSRFEAGR